MESKISAAAVLLNEPERPRRHKDSDLHLPVRFRVLPEEEGLERVARLDGSAPPDAEDGASYQAAGSGGLGLYGELRELRGRRLRRGDIVKLELGPQRSGGRVRCLGFIAWIRVDPVAGLFRAGVGFVGVDRRDLR